MTVGTGIALVVIGAILAFAINLENAWVDFDLIGYILMGAGVVVFIIGLVLLVRRRQTVSETRIINDPATGDRVSRQVTEHDDTPMV